MASSSIALNYSLAQQTNNLLENGFSSHHKEQMLLISALDLLIYYMTFSSSIGVGRPIFQFEKLHVIYIDFIQFFGCNIAYLHFKQKVFCGVKCPNFSYIAVLGSY
jgi:hypothetical protein